MASAEESKSLADQVALLCYKHFDEKLPKKGKPLEGREWTILAAIIKQDSKEGNMNLEVISMGTGSKCLGQSQLSCCGDLLNDSHAEIMARRGFLRYMYNQMESIASGEESSVLILDPASKKFQPKPEVSFVFFASWTFCGDASIMLKENSDAGLDSDNELQPSNIKLDGPEEPLAKRQKLEILDVHRTGAKCCEGGPQDPKKPGIDHHIIGVLRTKPGRGDRTLSMSCSDKLAKWNILGIQGSLLMNFLSKPLYLSHVVIGKCPFSQNAIERALVDRFEKTTHQIANSVFRQQRPKITQSQLKFKFSKEAATELGDCQLQPCPSSITWCACPVKQLEVAVDGRKQGVTKKNQSKPECRLEICKKNLFQKFANLIRKLKADNLPHHLKEHALNLDNMTYNEAKQLSSDYIATWKQIRDKIFPTWTIKPLCLTEFTIADS